MGVERAVSCWYAHRQLVLQRIAQLEAMLSQPDTSAEDKVSARTALARAQEELHSLGPCPRPMMG